MAVGLKGLPELHPVSGIRWGTASAGIKKPGRRDLAAMEMVEGSSCAAVFTRNAFCAAPVTIARKHLAESSPKLLIINSGNANAGTGPQGLDDALAVCASLANQHGCQTNQVLPFSTGVIGEPLAKDIIIAALPQAYTNLSSTGWEDAAHGIMTTDTVPKGASTQIDINGHTVTITGITKGAGMIRPDMATMLAYIATDAGVSKPILQECLNLAVKRSFNCITVDGDTSTNDAVILVATGKSNLPTISTFDDVYTKFSDAIVRVCEQLAQAIVRDGEGATKFITIAIEGGASEQECKQVAYTIAHSPLVKTACFASDPNWGRILAAVGRAGVAGLDINKVTISLDNVSIVRDGGRDPDYREELGQQVMNKEEITINVNLGRGANYDKVWTCDLSYDYVKINAEYRT
jgi:glutamate N-acetyltransferase/amino-acid N-acetyltransferase